MMSKVSTTTKCKIGTDWLAFWFRGVIFSHILLWLTDFTPKNAVYFFNLDVDLPEKNDVFYWQVHMYKQLRWSSRDVTKCGIKNGLKERENALFKDVQRSSSPVI